MKNYRIAMPPKHPGVYLLKNQTTKAVYVGQSTNLYRRFCEWRSCLQGGYGIRSLAVSEAVNASDVQDWEFVVVREMPRATAADLLAAEQQTIAAFDSRKIPLLNHQPVLAPKPLQRPGPKAMVTITHQGNQVTYRQAAEILGCSIKTIAKRSARYRGRGSEVVRLEDWLETSKKYRAG